MFGAVAGRLLFASVALVILSGCQGTTTQSASPAQPSSSKRLVGLWMTTPDGKHRLDLISPDEIPATGDYQVHVSIDTGVRYQKMIGMGAAITDASADLLQHTLPATERSDLIRELFDPDAGLGLSFTRVVIGASDFSTRHYSLDDSPGNEPDPNLSHFSIGPLKETVIPTLQAARQANPSLVVMASPWSPPAWMKTSKSLITGRLLRSAYQPFADYLVKTVREFGENGIPVDYISLQNEPDFEPADYPGMRLPARERAELISDFVGPAFAASGLDVQILEWDHNWDQPQQPLDVLSDAEAAAFVSGVAWHCYAGDVAAQDMVRRRHPDKDVFFTECSGGEWSSEWPDAWSWTIENLIIGATQNWARGVLLWNIALDEDYGPHLGGCGNCRGVVTVSRETGKVTRNQEYYALAHYSRFVDPGAYRIEAISSSATVKVVAFQNPNGEIVLIAFNSGDGSVDLKVDVSDTPGSIKVLSRSAITAVWAIAG